MWVKFPEGIDLVAIREKVFADTNAGYSTGPVYSPDRTAGKNFIRLSFGYNTPAEITEGMALLANAFRHEGVLA